MSKKALVPVNVLASAAQPTGKYVGDLYFDTLYSIFYLFNGSSWIEAGTATSLDGGSPETGTDGGSYNTTTFEYSLDGGSL